MTFHHNEDLLGVIRGLAPIIETAESNASGMGERYDRVKARTRPAWRYIPHIYSSIEGKSQCHSCGLDVRNEIHLRSVGAK